MPRREQLARKGIHEDKRRLRSMPSGAGPGAVAPHSLLGSVHKDTVIAAVVEGAMVLGDDTPDWNILLHPTAAGYALVTGATTFAWDQTPTWTGDHTWDDGDGDSPALHLIPENNDDWQIWAANNATPGDSILIIKFPAADTGSLILFRDSADNDVAYIDGDGNTTWDGTAHRFGIADTAGAIVTVSGAAAGSDEGGQLTLETAADHDGVFNSWSIDVNQDDLRFFRSDAGVINAMTAEGQLSLPTTGSAAGILLGGDAQWYRSAANMMSTPDNVTIETRCFGFLKAQDEDGRVGNGPVEYGEVIAVGGIMEVAPACALWATVTIN